MASKGCQKHQETAGRVRQDLTAVYGVQSDDAFGFQSGCDQNHQRISDI